MLNHVINYMVVLGVEAMSIGLATVEPLSICLSCTYSLLEVEKHKTTSMHATLLQSMMPS